MNTDQRTADAERHAGLSWFDHVRATLLLGLPLAGAQIAQTAINVTSTVMVGQLGTAELAGAVLATQFFHLVWVTGSGFAIAVMPMAAGAIGRGDAAAARRAVRMGFWVCALFGTLAFPLLSAIRPIMLALGQDATAVEEAGVYMDWLRWAIFPALALMVLRSFLAALQRANVVFAITLIGVAFNALVAYALINGVPGLPALGVSGAGLAGLLTMAVMAIVGALYAHRAAEPARYEIFVRFWRPDWRGFAEVARLGAPIGATIVAEVGLFAASSVMVGWIGRVELAAHGIALQLSSLAFMIPLGLASAATVRVGLSYGRGDGRGIARAARAAVLVGLTIALGSAFLFWSVPHVLIGFYLDREAADASAVLAYAIPLLAVAAAFQLVDSMQALASGVLRGLRDTRVPMILALFSYWIVGMPSAYLLAFPAGLGGVGVWSGLGIGLLCASVLLSARFLRRERRGALTAGR